MCWYLLNPLIPFADRLQGRLAHSQRHAPLQAWPTVRSCVVLPGRSTRKPRAGPGLTWKAKPTCRPYSQAIWATSLSWPPRMAMALQLLAIREAVLWKVLRT